MLYWKMMTEITNQDIDRVTPDIPVVEIESRHMEEYAMTGETERKKLSVNLPRICSKINWSNAKSEGTAAGSVATRRKENII